MTNKIRLFLSLIVLIVFAGCVDDENFSSSTMHRLSFSTDSVKFDTVFSTIPTPTKTFWVHNDTKYDLRCSTIRLRNGNQTGYRVNVDGVYLGNDKGYLVTNQEIRRGDSIRVFVELTSPVNHSDVPLELNDDIVFALESGVEQAVKLNAFSWDADILDNVSLNNDTLLGGSKPTVVYGTLTVAEDATLTVPAGKTLYMHGNAMIDVYGTLLCAGQAGNEVVLRGDRLDNMFDYLPYDGVSGQWKGIRFRKTSMGNKLNYTDLHGACNAIVCDSSGINRLKLEILNSTVHNNQGDGVLSKGSALRISNSQISNCLGNCVSVYGGVALINNSTLAQFYPFDGKRGAALHFTNFSDSIDYPLYQMEVHNSIVTGYADDVIMGEAKDSLLAYSYLFDHSLLRTPELEDTINCRDIIWETTKDTIPSGMDNFRKVDADKQQYDFHLADKSPAVDAASPSTSLPTDREGTRRDEKPDMGCYEYVAPASEETPEQ